jgi:hypothetical protein
MLIHTVYFWLKDDVTDDDRAFFRETINLLAELDAVACYIGPPAATEARPVIDASYDLGLTVVFDSIAQHDVYQEHPKHLEFIDKCNHLWERVQVYDAEG